MATILEDDTPVLALAANGDRPAQARMVDHVVGCAEAGQVPLGIALGAAEVFARMAAESGEPAHLRKLGGVLLWQSENLWNSGYYERSRIYQVEAVELLNKLADDGDEEAGALIAAYGGAFSPDILRLAADLGRTNDRPPEDGDSSPDTVH